MDFQTILNFLIKEQYIYTDMHVYIILYYILIYYIWFGYECILYTILYFNILYLGLPCLLKVLTKVSGRLFEICINATFFNFC